MKTTVQNKTVILTLAQYNARKAAGTLEQGVTYKIKGSPVTIDDNTASATTTYSANKINSQIDSVRTVAYIVEDGD